MESAATPAYCASTGNITKQVAAPVSTNRETTRQPATRARTMELTDISARLARRSHRIAGRSALIFSTSFSDRILKISLKGEEAQMSPAAKESKPIG